jgi:hypothetical protein
MEKVTTIPEWKDNEPMQEPLTQSDLVSESQVNQYKQQKKAQINTNRKSPTQSSIAYTPPTSQPTSHPSYGRTIITGLIMIIVGIFIIICIGPALVNILTNSISALPTTISAMSTPTNLTSTSDPIQVVTQTMGLMAQIMPALIIVGLAIGILEFSQILKP